MAKRPLAAPLAVGILAVLSSAARAVQLGQLDNFQDSTVQNWAGGDAPTNIPSGGPAGTGDAYLQITAGGGVGHVNLATFNATQWSGDYQNAGITAVSVDFLNPGATPADMRVVLFGPDGGRFTSAAANVVPPDDLWHHFVFSLQESDLIDVLPSDTYADTIDNVSQLMFRHDATGSFGGTSFTGALGIDNVLATALSVSSAWNLAAGATWGSAASWTNAAIPQTAGDTANFAAAINAPATITLDGSRTVAAITFNSAQSYTLAQGSGGSLALNNGASAATIMDLAGNHFITAPVVLSSPAVLSVSNAGDSLNISTAITGGGSLTIAGAGTVRLSGSAKSTLSSLAINPGATLDLTSDALLIPFNAAASDPAAALIAALTAGYNNGKWTGQGIASSSAAADPGKFALGFADGNVDTGTSVVANQFLIEFTLAGDANLNGSVDFPDLVSLAQNFGFTGRDWTQGNFTYDPAGSVGFDDLVLLAQNFGFSTPIASDAFQATTLSPAWQSQPTSVVPEPATFALATAASVGLLPRRRRASKRRG